MAFRSLAVLSFLLIGASTAPAATAPPDTIAALNAALAARTLMMSGGVPVLK